MTALTPYLKNTAALSTRGCGDHVCSLMSRCNPLKGVAVRRSTYIGLILILANLLTLQEGWYEWMNVSLDVASNLVLDLMVSTTGLHSLRLLREDTQNMFFEVLLEVVI